jgi:Flp pilus assembly protein TadG
MISPSRPELPSIPNPAASKRERGQSLVELAISLIILLLLLAGVIDLGRAFFTFMSLRDAAQEGASYGSLFPTISKDDPTLNVAEIEQRVRNASNLPVNLTSADITVSVSTLGGPPCAGSGMQVQVVYPDYPMIMPLFQAVMGRSTIPIRATVTDEIVRPRCP